MCVFLFVCDAGFSQPSTFYKMYNRGNTGTCVREQNGNSFLVAGGTNYYYNYHWMQMSPVAATNVHLFKTTSQGNLLWEKVLSNPAARTMAIWMEPTSDGGAIVTGHANSDVFWPPDSNNILLVKTDNAGNVSWAKSFDSGKDELGYCVRQTFDGGFAVSGFHDASPVSLMGNTHALLLKTDVNGDILWEKKYQLPVRDFDTGESFPVVFRQTADSGYVLVSTTSGAHQADVCVIRTDAAGNLTWAKSYEHDNTMFRLSVGLDITESQSGDFIIAGSMDKNRILSQYNYPFIMKLNSGGSLLDARILSSVPDLMFQSGFSSVEQTADGGFFFTGMGGYGEFGDQAQLLKTDGMFNMQWSRVYTWDGVATMGARSARSTSDGCYIFTGKRQFSGTVVMKTNSVGMIPCKTPGVMAEIIPSVLTVNRTPAVTSGMNVTAFGMNSQVFLTDTAVVCPVIITTLPVSLLSFTARQAGNNRVLLEWITASEKNLEGFVIERSFDGIHYSEAGYLHGSGNSSNTVHYSYNDYNLFNNEMIYYRLRQVDFDGSYIHSPVVTVRMNSEALNMTSVVIDYDAGALHFILNNFPGHRVNYTVTDAIGRVVFTGSQSEEAQQVLQLDISTGNLSKGMYFYSIWSDTKAVSGKIFY